MVKRTKSAVHKELDRLIDELRKSRLRVTEPRISILQVFLEQHGPFTAEEIYDHIKENSCDLATIYRTLSSLEKSKIITRCEFGDGTARYELSSNETHHHHHLICKICKKIEALDDCELLEINQYAKKRGFTEISHSLEFFGICPACQKY